MYFKERCLRLSGDIATNCWRQCRVPGCFSYVSRILEIIKTQNTPFHVLNFVEMRSKVTLWYALRVSNWSVPLSSTYIFLKIWPYRRLLRYAPKVTISKVKDKTQNFWTKIPYYNIKRHCMYKTSLVASSNYK